VDPTCHKCDVASHTLELWLQERPTTAAQQLRFLGSTDPLLSVLVLQSYEVILYAGETLSRDMGVAHSSSSK